jgi:hypothetical protein
MKTKKQQKTDKAFIKKISSLNIGGKFVAGNTPPSGVPSEIHVKNCPCCKGKTHVFKYAGYTAEPCHDESQEQVVTE